MALLVELGASRLIELGDSILSGPDRRPESPVLDIFRVVNFLESPAAGIELEPGESISPRQAAISQRLSTLSKMVRRSLAHEESSLRGLGTADLLAEIRSLSKNLNLLSEDTSSLGKSKKKFSKRLKKVGKKVVKVVKSPAFLSVVGVAANLIPGAGQAASSALLSTAALRARKEEEKKARKEMKKAERQAAREAAAADEAALNEWYRTYGPEYLAPMGYTPEVWSKLTHTQKRDVANRAADGTLTPYGPPDQKQISSEVARSAALSVAVSNKYGEELPGEGVDLSALPPEIQEEAIQLAPEYEKHIEAAGKENFLAAIRKALGQGASISALAEGVGVELPGGLSELFKKFGDKKAVEAGKEDLINTAALTGSREELESVLQAGKETFPWIPLAIAGGVILSVSGVIIVLSKR